MSVNTVIFTNPGPGDLFTTLYTYDERRLSLFAGNVGGVFDVSRDLESLVNSGGVNFGIQFGATPGDRFKLSWEIDRELVWGPWYMRLTPGSFVVANDCLNIQTVCKGTVRSGRPKNKSSSAASACKSIIDAIARAKSISDRINPIGT